MKLIDLLVQELPKRGGWPDNVMKISMNGDGTLFSDGRFNNNLRFDGLTCSDGWVYGMPVFYNNAVSKEQYEAALAASKRTEWDGEGLPPVGAVIEYSCVFFNPNRPAIEKGQWYKGTVIAYYDDCVWTSDNGIRPLDNTQFRPIRTEADRKRDDVVDSIVEHYIGYHGDPKGGEAYIDRARAIYAAIAAGKIPGIKLDGDA